MSVIRINKNKDYVTMSNYHFKEKEMSLKAKGLLSQMLSLPDDWDYSIEGLASINKENETAIKTTLEELKNFGYLKVTKLLPNQTKTGRIEYVYDIYERKQEGKKQGVENLGVEFLGVEFLEVENQGQYNINNKNINNKNINNIKEEKYKKEETKKETKKEYGEYKRVKLTDKEYEKLCNEFNKIYIDEIIKLTDEYIESNNNKNKYTNFNLVIRRAIRENWFNISKETKSTMNRRII